jgi:hypothetical protein
MVAMSSALENGLLAAAGLPQPEQKRTLPESSVPQNEQ